jgi:NDP-sugar pyrophosphorylase family protein
MEAILLVGGLATRLGELARDTPKALMPVAGKPVIAHQVDLLRTAGVTRVVLASGHLHEKLRAHVGKRYRGVAVDFVTEDKRLDTGGAIANAMNALSSEEPFFVLNGDVLTDADLALMRRGLAPSATGILLGVRVEDISPYGEILADDDRVLSFVEKRAEQREGIINAGVYLFRETVRTYFPKREVFSIERDVFPFVPDLRVSTQRARWIDVGTPERLAEASDLFADSGKETICEPS